MSHLSDPSLNQHDGCEAAIDVHSIRTFLRQWMRDPVKTASVTPSGRQLARLMVAQLVPGSARVAELGAGTGVFTRALLDAGISPSQLLVVEINPDLAEFLREKGTATTAAINRAWKAQGRGGVANNILGVLLRDGQIVRAPAEGRRGSVYRVSSGAAKAQRS